MGSDPAKRQVANLGTIMGIWAHPDDETFMTGGVMALAADNGQIVVCVTATRGGAGVKDENRWPAKRLSEIRTKETEAALSILGVNNHHWLDYEDGGGHLVPENEAVGRLTELIDKYSPDTIFTFAPDGMTGHFDHQAVSRWACLAAEQATKKPAVYFGVETTENYDEFMREADEKHDIYFNVDKPALVSESDCDLGIELPGKVAEQKIRALLAMESQTDGMKLMLEDARFVSVLSRENFVRSDRTDLEWNKAYWQK